MGDEAGKQEAATVSPWEVLLWKLDSLDKRVEGMDQRLNRRMDRMDERSDRLEQRADRLEQRFDRLEQRFDRLEQRLSGEISGLRGEVHADMAALRGWAGDEIASLRQEVRGTRASFTVLELTAVLGFVAVLVSIWLQK